MITKFEKPIKASSWMHNKEVDIIGYHISSNTVVLDCMMGNKEMLFRLSELKIMPPFNLTIQDNDIIVKNIKEEKKSKNYFLHLNNKAEPESDFDYYYEARTEFEQRISKNSKDYLEIKKEGKVISFYQPIKL